MIFRPRPCSAVIATGSSLTANPPGAGSPSPAAGVDDLDGAPAVPGAHLNFVLLAGAGVLNNVGAGLAERQGDVGAGIRRDPERLEAGVKDLAPDRHADSIARQVKGHLDLHAIHLRQTLTTSGGH